MNRIFIALLILTAACSAQSLQDTEDGSWWKRMTPEFRLAFVSGYVQGAERANIGQMGDCMGFFMYVKPIKDTYTAQQWQKICFPSADFDGVTMGQFREGLDAFYSDFRNYKITFDPAIEYVRDEIKGKARSELEVNLERMRKCAADSKACLVATEPRDLPIPTPK